MRSYLRTIATLRGPVTYGNNVLQVPQFGGFDTTAGDSTYTSMLPGSEYGVRIRPVGNFRVAKANDAVNAKGYPRIDAGSVAFPPGLPLRIQILDGSGGDILVSDSGWYPCQTSKLMVIPSYDPFMSNPGSAIVGDFIVDVADSEEDIFVGGPGPTPGVCDIRISNVNTYGFNGSHAHVAAPSVAPAPGQAFIWPHYKALRLSVFCDAAGTITKWVYDNASYSWCVAGTFSYPTANQWTVFDEDCIAGAQLTDVVATSENVLPSVVFYQCPGTYGNLKSVLSARMSIGG